MSCHNCHCWMWNICETLWKPFQDSTVIKKKQTTPNTKENKTKQNKKAKQKKSKKYPPPPKQDLQVLEGYKWLPWLYYAIRLRLSVFFQIIVLIKIIIVVHKPNWNKRLDFCPSASNTFHFCKSFCMYVFIVHMNSCIYIYTHIYLCMFIHTDPNSNCCTAIS